jgi:hypothetical protein
MTSIVLIVRILGERRGVILTVPLASYGGYRLSRKPLAERAGLGYAGHSFDTSSAP